MATLYIGWLTLWLLVNSISDIFSLRWMAKSTFMSTEPFDMNLSSQIIVVKALGVTKATYLFWNLFTAD